MAIAGGSMTCYTMKLKNGRLDQQKSTGNKDTVTEDADDAARRILAGESVDVLADFPTLKEVWRLVDKRLEELL